MAAHRKGKGNEFVAEGAAWGPDLEVSRRKALWGSEVACGGQKMETVCREGGWSRSSWGGGRVWRWGGEER